MDWLAPMTAVVLSGQGGEGFFEGDSVFDVGGGLGAVDLAHEAG